MEKLQYFVLLAGLETVDSGKIYSWRSGDNKSTNLPTQHKYRFSTVCPFPHLTVFENVAYSLRSQGISKMKKLKKKFMMC